MTGRCLSGDRRLRYGVFGALYAAQGIPDAMVLIVFPAFLAANGAGVAMIGAFLATAMLPNAAKLVIGPLIDRLAYLPMGRRKPWLMAGQVGIASSFAAMALIDDPVKQIGLFTAGAFLITFATAFQDVATDATAMDLIPADEQGRANSIMWGAKTLGTAGAASIGAWILVRYGFAAMTAVCAAALVAVLCLVATIRERPGERLLPWMPGAVSIDAAAALPDKWNAIWSKLIQELRRSPVRRLVFLSLMIGLLVGMTGALAPVLMVKQFDWAQSDYAQFRSALKLVSGIAAMLVGGFVIDRLGHRKVLVLMLSALALANVLFMVFPGQRGATAYLIAYEMLLVFVFITFFAATMSQCSRVIAATQFSFTMVCGNITMSFGAAMMGPIMAFGGVTAMLVAIAVVALAGAGIMFGWRPDGPGRATPIRRLMRA